MKYSNTSRRSFLGKTAVAVAGMTIFSTQETLANLLNNSSPFIGYNPYSELKSDLRTFSGLEKTLKVSGVVYDRDGIKTIPNAKIEVWHLSPNANKYKHRGYFFSDAEGHYTFKTDYPNRTEGKKPRIYFKTTKGNKTSFSELVLDKNCAYITSEHWAENKALKAKLQPKFESTISENKIQFNFTI